MLIRHIFAMMMQSGDRKFADRGLLPRCLSYIYKMLQGESVIIVAA